MPRIDLDILNQKQTPAFYASSLATRPAASYVGRIFIDSDNPSTGLYRDTGTAWVQIADPGAGTTGTLQQVTTNGNSTTTGITITTNGLGIGTTIPGTNRLDIHSSSGINATFNGTGTTNAALQLQLAGVGKWNLSNLYNAAANDFIITDVLNTKNRLTIKNTGQTFIGTDTTSSGLFVVNSSTSDNHYVAIGSNAPSYRLRDVGSGGALNCGLGISTASNNFIQGSVNGDYCIFNSSTTASPILFGVYNGTNTQEAARLSAARNFIINSTVDSGYRFEVNGTSRFVGTTYYNASSGVIASIVGGSNLFTIVSNDSLVISPVQTQITSSTLTLNNTTINGKSTQNGNVYNFTNSLNQATGLVKIINISGNYPTQTGGSSRAINIETTLSNDSIIQTFIGIYYNPTISGLLANTNHKAFENTTGNVFFGTTSGSVGIGASATINTSAILQVTSTTQGFLPPRMTTAQKNAIATPTTGLVVYDSTINKLALYTGAGWETVTST